MSTEVKVGQVWRDKDKRRNTTIEIIEGPYLEVKDDTEIQVVTGLVVGTEEERWYNVERLVKRWEVVSEKANAGLDRGKQKPAQTREEYLEFAVTRLVDRIFITAGVEVPEVRVSVGWPGGRGPKKGVIGQCFDARVTKDGKAQIFITPAIDDSYVVVETLAHELIHATVEGQEGEEGNIKHHGHRGDFVRVARDIGFTAPWKSTPASEELRAQIQEIVDELGSYPHAAITLAERPPIQKTYYLKVACPEHEDYFVRMTATKIEEFGAPLCPLCQNEMEEV